MIPLDESCNFHTSKMDRVKGPRRPYLGGVGGATAMEAQDLLGRKGGGDDREDQ